MAKFIIYITGKPMIHGFKRREFQWSQDHGLYLFQGKVIEENEFNDLIDRALVHYQDMNPRVKIVEKSPKLEIEAPEEITVAQAEEAMERLAPHRLKKKPGPKEDSLIHA